MLSKCGSCNSLLLIVSCKRRATIGIQFLPWLSESWQKAGQRHPAFLFYHCPDFRQRSAGQQGRNPRGGTGFVFKALGIDRRLVTCRITDPGSLNTRKVCARRKSKRGNRPLSDHFACPSHLIFRTDRVGRHFEYTKG